MHISIALNKFHSKKSIEKNYIYMLLYQIFSQIYFKIPLCNKNVRYYCRKNINSVLIINMSTALN